MHRSPKASLLFLVIMVGLCGWAQDNQATPKPGSGIPQTPVPNTAPAQPPVTAPDSAPSQATQPPAVEQPKSADQPAAPANGQQGQGQPAASGQNSTVPKTAEQKAADQRVADQKSADQKKSNAGTGTALPAATPTPIPQAQPKTDILDSSATSGALATDGHDPILDPAPMPDRKSVV